MDHNYEQNTKQYLTALIRQIVKEELNAFQQTTATSGEKELLNTKEVCELLGIGLSTLYARMHEGVIKSYKLGNSHRRIFKRSEVLGAMEEYGFPW